MGEEAFSVSGFLCEDCNEKYYSVDIESSYRELVQLTDRYGIKIE
jgi:transcription initiation factor IIE alpha subunit